MTEKPLSSSVFESFIEKGTYQKMKEKENFLKQSKAYLREIFEPSAEKRHEFKNGMVAKFVSKNVYETNHSSLIEELFCYLSPEFVFPLIKLDDKQLKEQNLLEELIPFQLPPKYYVRPTLNKVGKSKIIIVDYLFGGQTEEELMEEIRNTNDELKLIKDEYNSLLKSQIINCPVLRDKKKVSTKYGSISLIQKKPEWNLEHLYKKYGEDIFIQYGNVQTGMLEEMVLQGAIPYELIKQHRKVVDVQLDFVVMRIEDEERLYSLYHRRKMAAAQKRLA